MADNRPVDSKVVNPQDSATPDTETVSPIANAMPEGEAASLEVTSKAAVKPRRHRFWKTKLLLILVVIGLASWFGYKYTYIFLERRKYARAETALRKVADDLRAQGIETTFSRGCTYKNQVFSIGEIEGCNQSITYSGYNSKNIPGEYYAKFLESLKKVNAVFKSINTNSSLSAVDGHSENLSLPSLKMNCELYYSPHLQDNYWIGLSCGGPSNFKLF